MAKQEKKRAVKDPSYPKSDLIAAAESFGVKTEVMAGALYNVERATKAEAKQKLQSFLQKEV